MEAAAGQRQRRSEAGRGDGTSLCPHELTPQERRLRSDHVLFCSFQSRDPEPAPLGLTTTFACYVAFRTTEIQCRGLEFQAKAATRLIFCPFQKNLKQEKPSFEENSILAKKNSRYRSHLNISAKKLKIFILSGSHFDRFMMLKLDFSNIFY